MTPPYVVKLSNKLQNIFPKLSSSKFNKSNANYAILMSKRNFVYKHKFEKPISNPSPFKTNFFTKSVKKRLKIVMRNLLRYFFLMKLKLGKVFKF